MDFVLTGFEQVGGSPPQVPLAAVAQARRAASLGVGLDTVLRRYVAGHAILEDFVMQEADPSELLGQRIELRGVLGSETRPPASSSQVGEHLAASRPRIHASEIPERPSDSDKYEHERRIRDGDAAS